MSKEPHPMAVVALITFMAIIGLLAIGSWLMAFKKERDEAMAEAQAAQVKPLEPRLLTPAMATAHVRPEGRWGYPTPAWRERHGYVIAQPGKYTPWSAEVLTMRRLGGEHVERSNDFHADEEVPVEFRATLRDYEGAGVDRGHETPSDDCRESEAAQSDSFLLSNMMPQSPELNRGPWAQLEKHVRELVADGRTAVYVFTGPAFLPDSEGRVRFETVGSHTLWKPTHCWKTVLVAHDDEPTAAHAWMAPNLASPGTFDDWVVTVDDLERAVGMDFWSELDSTLQEKLESVK